MSLRARAQPAAAALALVLALAACQSTQSAEPLQDSGATAAEPIKLGTDGTWYMAGTGYLAAREPGQAERAFIRSLAQEGITPEALTALGVSVAQQGRLNQARRHLEQARALAPEDIRVHNNLGVVLFHLGEYDGAREAFQTSFLVSSGRDEIARLYLERVEAAIASTRVAPEQNPAISHRVDRVGRGEYRLLETSSEPAAATESAEPPG